MMKPKESYRVEAMRGSTILEEFTINEMTLADKIVSTAETWVGTPFQHQGRLKFQGVDCAGFISEVAKEAGVSNVEIPANYRPHEDGKVMMQLLKDHMKNIPIEKMQKGDVLALCDEALREPEIPRHLVIVKEVTPEAVFIIHATASGVKAHRINSRWRSRIHSCWRIRA
jgi:cell wall-associated NlpC family hydrolase